MHEALLSLDSGMASALAGLSPRQTQETPRNHPDKWNIQQIVEHLVLTYRSTTGVLEARISKGTPTLTRPTLPQRFGQALIFTCGYFPRGLKAPAPVSPAALTPIQGGEDLARYFHQNLAALDLVADRAEALFGGRPAITHMVLGPLSVPQWRRFHLVHGRHHLRQILSLRNQHSVASPS